ncbi:hypothetical protein AVV27_gp47 [Achromobacter phage 83-24]|uniref:Uncharacterized protein n=1 Tax=Achromobacter phage 83-24 TaxID=1589747 RepID=A0A0B4ZZF8_9CAUD|nr:hypothetical protein AVV27_gp04 [Achromobacter phage 83-24]YP_009201795.1 hypothetical protein AVV27_gp47 [Achromobacter phage 83-24]AJD82837.1 hypothetical protein JWAP_00004 [Achromobacter phage 83-24]AJD82894.1 hypothetical protein JWAP_00062 [Achromobacter phage 83-24]
MTEQRECDIMELEAVTSFICNNLGFSDEMQRLISQIELRIMELKEE